MTQFTGRKKELAELTVLLKRKIASFVVIRGRRRVGKSRLIEEFGKAAKFYEFTGLSPTRGTTAKKQRMEFMRQFRDHFGLSSVEVNDWGDIFALLAKETANEQVIILLDEISWMGSKDATFLGKLKIAWDIYFKNNPRLILVLCGSVSSWIEKNILNHTGFVGRISLSMQIEELPIVDCEKLLLKLGCKYPSYELFKILGVTGGIPRYLEEFQGGWTADENIKRICFRTDGLLYREFDQLFSDLFSSKKETYKKIIALLGAGEMEAHELAQSLGYHPGGYVSSLLSDLVKAGFLKKTYVWDLRGAKEKQRPRFRLIDNYLRFFLRYIEPNRGRIEGGHFVEQTLSSFPGWNALMGLQFENLVLRNREFVFESLRLRREDILFDNPFVQNSTKHQKGCQIDYLVHTRFRMLFVCEIKFSRDPIGTSVIDEMVQKIDSLKLPRGYSCVPVLIHLSGVTDALIEREYFSHIIDFSKIIE